jgi:hypothetical protein
MPGAVLDGWNAYAAIQRFTNRNGWLKQNVSALRSQANLNNLVMSPSASGGLAASSITLTAGANQITVDLTEPSLPTGWTTTKAYAAAIADQDPQSGVLYDVTAGTDAAAPWSIVLAGLTTAQLYQVGGWFQFTKDDGTFAYGVAISDTATPT